MNKKVINVTRLLSILFAFALVGTSHATDWYVSPSGSNSNSGTSPSTPFQTLNKGRDMAQAGDTVYIMNGTYYNAGFGTGNVNNLGTAFLINKSGSAAAGYLTFKNFPDHTPKIKYDGASGIAVAANVHHVIIEGLEIEGPAADITYAMAIANRIDPNPANYYNNRGIVGWGPHNNIIIRNCFAHDTCNSGIRFNKSDYMTIEDCEVARTCWWGRSGESGIVFAEALEIDSSTGIKMIMRRNLAYDNWNRLPMYTGNPDPNDYGGANYSYILDGQGLYITRCPGYNGTFLFENNICVNNGKNGINFDHSSSASGIMANNTLYMNGAADLVQTEWAVLTKTAGITFQDVGHATVANNIIVCRPGYNVLTRWDSSQHTVVNNLLEGGNVHNMTLGTGNITTLAAGMVNPSSDVTVGDYSLAAGSPCIDAADATYAPADDYIYAARPFGASDDIGALERISGNSAPTWNADPFYQADANASVAYSSYIDWRVTDLDGDTLTYTKVSGPAWATVSSGNGHVQGTPAASDVGLNTFVVSVSDGINPPVEAIMYITVQESRPNHAACQINAIIRHQKIEGFGASGVHYVNWLQAHPDKNEIYDVIFRQLGLDILRIGNAYDHNDGAARIAGWAELVDAAETSLGRPIEVMITSGSPPAYLKSNNDTSGGTLAKYPGGGYKYDLYAQWWADSLEYYSSSGIDIECEYVSMQNEPDHIDVWDTCKFTPAETSEWAGYNQAFEAFYQELDSRSSKMPKLLAPETIGFGRSQAYIDELIDVNHVYGFAHHLYGDGDYNQPDSFVPGMQNYSSQYGFKPLLQTEFAHARDVSFGAALTMSRHIHNSLVYEGVCSYCYWDLFWGDSGGLVTIEFPWQSNPGYTINPTYYAFKHYSAFIHSGWRRLDVSNDSLNPRISAYISPDNQQMTVVLINTDPNIDVELDLSFDNFSVEDGNVYRTSSTQNCTLIGDFNDSAPLTLPAESITTLALSGTLIITDCQQVQDAGLNLAGDLNGNCYVDLADVSVLTDQWLSTDPVAIPPNYSPDISFPTDDKVNLLDFAVLALDWLICNNPQDANCLKTW